MPVNMLWTDVDVYASCHARLHSSKISGLSVSTTVKTRSLSLFLRLQIVEPSAFLSHLLLSQTWSITLPSLIFLLEAGLYLLSCFPVHDEGTPINNNV